MSEVTRLFGDKITAYAEISAFLCAYPCKAESGEFLVDPLFVCAEVMQDGSTGFWVPFNAATAREAHSPAFGTVVAAGSGAEEFVARVTACGIVGDAKPVSAQEAIFRVMSMLGDLLIDEAGGVRGLENGWGAGFEVVVYNDAVGAFQRVNSMTYTAWDWQETHFQPMFLLKYEYQGSGDLWAFTLVDGQPVLSVAFDVRQPVGETFSITHGPPDFMSDAMCHVYLLSRNGRTYKIPTMFARGDETVKIFIDQDRYTIGHSTEFAATMRKRFAAMISAAAAKERG